MPSLTRPRFAGVASRWRATALLLVAIATLGQGCATSGADPDSIPSYSERTQTDAQGDLSVTVAVPTAAEAKTIYGVDLASHAIQPVWIQVENGSSRTYWMLDAGLDPDNFSVSEVAYAFGGADGTDNRLQARLYAQRFRNPVEPGRTVAGFVLTNLDENLKIVQVDLIARGDLKTFSFNVTDPTAELTSTHVDFANLYGPGQIIKIESEAELRVALQRLPCCTTNRKGTEFGDPLNLVLVGEREAITSALLRRDWRPDRVPALGLALADDRVVRFPHALPLVTDQLALCFRPPPGCRPPESARHHPRAQPWPPLADSDPLPGRAGVDRTNQP